MYCPFCDSKNVRIMVMQSPTTQVTCENCHRSGTFTEFHVLDVSNVGLIQTPDEAVYMEEQDLYDASDPTLALCITAHKVGSDAVYNVWTRQYGQWMKMIVERVIPDGEPAVDGLQGEILRFVTDERMSRLLPGNMRMQMAIRALMDQLSYMSSPVAEPQASTT